MKHPLDRKHQQSTYENIIASTAKYVVVEAPVGSGKSAYAAACGEMSHLKTMTLTRTKSLQDQYQRSYDFSVVKGKNSYACLHNFAPGADLCKIDKDDKDIKRKCDKHCPYPQACRDMLDSSLASLNYSKFFTELRQGGLVSQYMPDVLFLDEAHQLSDLVCEWSGCTLPWNDYLKQYIDPEYIHPSLPQAVAINKAVYWLARLSDSLADSEPYLSKRPDRKQVEAWRKWDSLKRKVNNTLDLVEQGKEYWFVQSTDETGFLLKPLTARFHFTNLFNHAPKIVLMSATIGEHRSFMSELGIYDDFESIIVPNIWPAESRPILDLDVPAISWKSTPEELDKHAREIARAINECPGSWNGLIHVPSKRMAIDLGQKLQRLTGRQVWTAKEGQGTEEMLQSWLEFESKHRGALAVSYAFHEGVDLPSLNINISARVPYPDMRKGSYEEQRFNFDVKAAQVRVANTLQQQMGRNRRGYAEHYGEQAEKLNAIADAKWRRLKWALSDDFKSSIK